MQEVPLPCFPLVQECYRQRKFRRLFRSQRASIQPREAHETPHDAWRPERKSVAILPFKNLSNDPETAFYEFSLADAVITELARVRSLVVRPSSVIVKYQGKQFDPGDVGRELSVDAILTASFLRADDRLASDGATARRAHRRDSLERSHRCRRQRHHCRAGHDRAAHC